MAKRVRDPEVDVMRAIRKQLDRLTPRAQGRVLAYMMACLFGNETADTIYSATRRLPDEMPEAKEPA